jgi:hypothetical protein
MESFPEPRPVAIRAIVLRDDLPNLDTRTGHPSPAAGHAGREDNPGASSHFNGFFQQIFCRGREILSSFPGKPVDLFYGLIRKTKALLHGAHVSLLMNGSVTQYITMGS